MVMEAMVRLQWKAFVKWLEDEMKQFDEDKIMENISQCLEAFKENNKIGQSIESLSSELGPLLKLFQEFKNTTRTKSVAVHKG